MGKSTISMAIFNSKLLVITRGYVEQMLFLWGINIPAVKPSSSCWFHDSLPEPHKIHMEPRVLVMICRKSSYKAHNFGISYWIWDCLWYTHIFYGINFMDYDNTIWVKTIDSICHLEIFRVVPVLATTWNVFTVKKLATPAPFTFHDYSISMLVWL